MGGEAVFRSGAGLPKDTGVVLFRKCKLKAKQTMDSAKTWLEITRPVRLRDDAAQRLGKDDACHRLRAGHPE